jgi:hypothetical protein
MTTESRRLIFSHAEATSAIRAYGAKNGLTFPNGKIIRARFAGGPEYEFSSLKQVKSPVQSDYNIKETQRAVTLTFFDDTTLEQKFYNLPADFISVSLVEYCLENKIMLPKKASKGLDVNDFNICLDISMETLVEGHAPTQRLALED